MAKLRMINDDYYSILHVAPTATFDEIARAYRRLAFQVHPDRNMNSRGDATAAFQLLSRAYETLKNVRSRRLYDLQIYPRVRQQTSFDSNSSEESSSGVSDCFTSTDSPDSSTTSTSSSTTSFHSSSNTHTPNPKPNSNPNPPLNTATLTARIHLLRTHLNNLTHTQACHLQTLDTELHALHPQLARATRELRLVSSYASRAELLDPAPTFSWSTLVFGPLLRKRKDVEIASWRQRRERVRQEWEDERIMKERAVVVVRRRIEGRVKEREEVEREEREEMERVRGMLERLERERELGRARAEWEECVRGCEERERREEGRRRRERERETERRGEDEGRERERERMDREELVERVRAAERQVMMRRLQEIELVRSRGGRTSRWENGLDDPF